MKSEEVKAYLCRRKLFADPTVDLLGNGEGHWNFLVTEGGQKVVVRSRRTDVPAPSDEPFGKEAEILAFIASQGIDFAPRSLLLDTDRHIHAITYVPGNDCSIAALPDKWLPRFVAQLVHIESLSYPAYERFCKETKRTPRRPQTTTEHFVNFGENWHVVIDANAGEPDVAPILEWLRPKYGYLFSEMKRRPGELVYIHSDLRWHPGGGNLRLNGNDLWFIDWEHARFVHTNLLELGDIIASIPEPEKNSTRIRTLIDLYQKETGMDPDALRDQLLYSIRYSKFTDVLWSAWRFLILRSEGGGWEKYRDMTNYRITSGNHYFDENIRLP